MIVGTEWLIEAEQCNAEKLRDENILRAIFSRVVADLGLKVISESWHKFDGEGGVTGMVMLTESHLTCHTYPEHGTATFNLYCCRTRPEWDWEGELRARLDSEVVSVTVVNRGSTKCNFESEISNLKSQSAGGDI
jgi:S-adenosylmethionine decarboxylase